MTEADTSIKFRDLKSSDEAWLFIRRFNDLVALGLAILHNGDLDIALDHKTVALLIEALTKVSKESPNPDLSREVGATDTDTTFEFPDFDSRAQAKAFVRRVEDTIALGFALKDDGDYEIAMDKKTAGLLIEALTKASNP